MSSQSEQLTEMKLTGKLLPNMRFRDTQPEPRTVVDAAPWQQRIARLHAGNFAAT
jgi:hypothetical protein